MNSLRKIIVPVFLFAAATFAHAHAFLDHADPRVGSTVKQSPVQIKIWFTEELEGAFSKIEVFDPSGRQVDKKDSKVDSANKVVMTVALPKLAAGNYLVKWNAVAVDTHHTMGTFTFEVSAP
jgi:copper resistance protein C